MHPALSVIFFTVSSGAGLGLLTWLIVTREFLTSASLQPVQFWPALSLSASLIIAGLLSSTLHLANRVNAWRALSRFKTSWLSREGVFALLLIASAALYAVSAQQNSPLSLHLGVVVLVLCAALVVSTGMIYACLKTIPRWHTRWVPTLFVAYALWSGLLLWLAFAAQSDVALAPWLRLAAALGLLALICSLAYQARVSTSGPTMNDALGLHGGSLRLLDAGHTHATFLTREFGYRLGASRASLLSLLVFSMLFALPLCAMVWETHTLTRGGYSLLSLAALSAFVGLLIDRWMFFAQAKHVVMLYHGQSIN